MSLQKIIIFTPTATEAAAFNGFSFQSVEVRIVVSGVGMAETAGAVAANLKDGSSLAILAGIAGAYPGYGLVPGDCVAVRSETIGDLGAVREGAFEPLFQREYISPVAGQIDSVKSARSLTVDCIGGPSIAGCGGYDIENMEGAAFFAICNALGIPFLEIRAVSNLTTDSREEWRISEALDSLREGVRKIIGELLTSGKI